MLGRKHRLPKFVNFKGERTIFFQAFTIKTKDNNLEFPRFAIIVSKKIDKKAVGRNKIKRQIRSFIKNLLADIKKGKDVLIIVKRDIRELPSGKISLMLSNAFTKAGLIK